MPKEDQINPWEKAMGYLKWRVKLAIIATIVFGIGFLIYHLIQ